MRIAYAIDSLGSGGAQRQAAELAKHLHGRDGIEICFLVYHPFDFWAPSLRDAGILVHLLPKRSRFDPTYPLRVKRWLQEMRIDLVHAFLLGMSLWQRLARVGWSEGSRPALVTAERNSNIATSRFQGLVQRFVYAGADAVTANAEPVAEAISNRLGIPRGRVHYLPNGIDLEAWDRSGEVPCPLPIEPDLFQIGLIGGLRRQKNHLFLLDALERIAPEVRASSRVWFVGGETGTSGYAASVRREIGRRSLQDCVRLAPETKTIASVMRALDLVVLPSLSEGFPNVVLEAMASRRPVIATPVGNVPAMITNAVTGFLVDVGDTASMARLLSMVHAMKPAERQRMGERARAAVEARFTLAVVAQQHELLYRQVLFEARRHIGGAKTR